MDLRELRRQEREKEISGRKEKVLEASLYCFAERGIENTTIADIARNACIGEASVYRYFANKETIAIECAKQFWDMAAKRYEELTAGAEYQEKSGISQVKELMELAARLFGEEREGFRFLHDFDGYLLSHRVDSGKLVEYEERIERLSPYLCSAIEKGKKDGTITAAADTEELYYTLTNTIFGLMQKLAGAGVLLKSDRLVESERKVELLLELLLLGLGQT